jgi:hypothetical protein
MVLTHVSQRPTISPTGLRTCVQIITLGSLLHLIVAVPIFNEMPDALVTDTSSQQVTSAAAFTSGAGNKDNSDTSDGVGSGSDVYNCYYGDWESFPPSSEWVSFEDMWTNAQSALESSCANTPSTGSGDSTAQIADVYEYVQQVAESSLVDHRFIFATIMQEVGFSIAFSRNQY